MPGSLLRELTPAEVQAMRDRGKIVLVDVREPLEYAAEPIHGALSVPLSTFDPKALPGGGCELAVLPCGSGKRSAMPLERCQAAGVAVGAHPSGGITAWRQARLPAVRLDADTVAVLDSR